MTISQSHSFISICILNWHRQSSTMQAFLFLFFLSLCFSLHLLMAASQQSYPSGDYSRDCSDYYPDNAGYLCEPLSPSCETLAYFRAQTGPFSSLSSIATQLFNITSSVIANASSLSSPDLKLGEGLYIPFTCTCNGNFSSHNTTYTIMPGDSFIKIANLTYEGLSTCRAIQDANPDSLASHLVVGKILVLPLRCACPSHDQKAKGIKLLVTYPVRSVGETISSVIDMFAVDRGDFLFANKIVNASQTLFAATTVLLPFKEKPTLPPNVSFIPPSPPSPGIKVHMAVAVASITPIGIIILILIAIAASCITKRFQRKGVYGKTFLRPNAIASPIVQSSQISHRPQVNLSQGMSELATSGRIIIYTIDEIYQATHGFHVSARIKGALYRGTIKGRDVAVKKMERDVSKEVQILQMLHHSTIISLLGFCTASLNESYLVYEYAENGSLHDWLHGHVHSTRVLACRERLQIALDIAFAMEYIHDHTYPRFVHKNINSNNILLDSKMRGKMTNFALAMAIDDNVKLHATHRRARNEDNTSHEHAMHTKESSKVTSHEHEMHSKVSPKVDVYAFGEVLLEMLKRKETPECNAGDLLAGVIGKESLRTWIDTCIEDNDVHTECAYAVAALARSCLAHDASAHPSARAVAFTLSKLLENCLSRH